MCPILLLLHCRWTDPSSLSGLLQRSPEGIHHLIVSYSEATAKQDAQWMHDQARLQLPCSRVSAHGSRPPLLLPCCQCRSTRTATTPNLQLRTHANRIWMPWRKREALFERLHFATVPVSRVPGALPSVLREWTYGQRCVNGAAQSCVYSFMGVLHCELQHTAAAQP